MKEKKKQVKTRGKNNYLKKISEQCHLPQAYLNEVLAGEKELSPPALEALADLDPQEQIFEEITLPYKGLGSKIKVLREEKNMTLEELGSKVGLSYTYLSEIERESRVPSLQTLKRISAVFNLSVSLFMNSQQKVLRIGKKIKHIREIRELTLKQLSTISDVSSGMIAQLESGKVYPSLKTLEKLSQALNVSACYLILEQEDIKGLLGGIGQDLREMIYDPDVQLIIGSICNLDKEKLKMVLNYIYMLNNPKL